MFMDAIPFWGNTGVLGQSGRGKVIPWFTLPYIGYEPAGLTVHPPPQNDREWVHFFRMDV